MSIIIIRKSFLCFMSLQPKLTNMIKLKMNRNLCIFSFIENISLNNIIIILQIGLISIYMSGLVKQKTIIYVSIYIPTVINYILITHYKHCQFFNYCHNVKYVSTGRRDYVIIIYKNILEHMQLFIRYSL